MSTQMNENMYYFISPYSLHTIPIFLFVQSVLVKLNLFQLLAYVIFALISRSVCTLRYLCFSSFLYL